MCCAGMSTVEAEPWDWFENLGALLYDNRGKVCLFVGVTGCVVAGCYYFPKKQPGTAENAIQIGETLIPLQQEEETPVLALEEEQDETQVQDLNAAENETRTENEALVRPRVVLVIDEAQDLALCIEKAEDDLELQKIARNAAGQAIQGALKKIGKRERACKNWALLVVQEQKRDNLKATLKMLQKDLKQYRSQLSAIGNLVEKGNGNNTSPREQNIQSKLSDFIASQQATIRDLSQTVKNNSETMKSQQETIQGLVRIVQNGEIIMLEILKKCNSPFDASSVANYRIDNIDQLDEENVKFIASEPGKQLAIITQNQEGSETVVAVCNAERSLCVLQQCLQGVEGLNRQKEEATQKVETLSKDNEALQQEKKSLEEEKNKADENIGVLTQEQYEQAKKELEEV